MMHDAWQRLQIAYTALLSGFVKTFGPRRSSFDEESITVTLCLACSTTAASEQKQECAFGCHLLYSLKTKPETDGRDYFSGCTCEMQVSVLRMK